MRVLLGTAPGLERVLLASVPSLIVGALSGWAFGAWIGLGLGLATMAILVVLSKGIGD